MMLFERMMQHFGERAKIAAEYAEYMRHDTEADRAQIGRELAAILERRERLAGDVEALAVELATRCSAADDFASIAGTDAAAGTNGSAQDAATQAGDTAQRLAADIAALDALFITICRALDAEGLTISGGKISPLKRQKIPKALAAELDNIKRSKVATLTPTERLTARDAAALFDGLTRQGLICGDLDAFSYYLAQQPDKGKKPPKNALSWTGSSALFAYFIDRYFRHIAGKNGKVTHPNKAKALCLAFGIDDKRRANTICKDLYNPNKKTTRGSALIDDIFNALPSATDTNAEANQYFEPD